jgi:hypothetical protein
VTKRGPEMPKAAWVSRGGLRRASNDVRDHRLGGAPIFPNLGVNHGSKTKEGRRAKEFVTGHTGQTKAMVLVDHGLLCLLVCVRDMMKPE